MPRERSVFAYSRSGAFWRQQKGFTGAYSPATSRRGWVRGAIAQSTSGARKFDVRASISTRVARRTNLVSSLRLIGVALTCLRELGILSRRRTS